LISDFLGIMEVTPFRGIRYNQGLVGDLAQVICPPYDVITPEQQRLYYRKSDYNAIRLEFPEPPDDRYRRAAVTFRQWLEQRILQYDTVSTFYLHEHRFEYLGKKMVRRGLIARVKLEPWGSGVFPHEETSSKAKRDRLELMRACRASFSPLLSLYQDFDQRISQILSRVAQQSPLMSLQARRSDLPDSDEGHSLWAVAESGIKRELGKLLSLQPIYIADGHHRYETALAYRQERAKEQSNSYDSSVTASEAKRSVADKAAFRYVMMELVEFSDPGLLILPLHRLVRGIAPSSLSELGDQLRGLFALESVPLGADSWRLPVGSCLGILGLQPDSLAVLNRRQDISLEMIMPDNRSQPYREFGVSILNHIILDKVLARGKDLDIAYTVDVEEVHQQIRQGKYQLAFLLHGPDPRIVKAVADAQDRMPRKSTYFYPKVPAGLVINPLD
jgi:uncharacterized protein (DUF1015 family)